MMSRRAAPGEERYQHIRELGRGGMGRVSLVYDRVRQEEVAQKRLARAGALDELRFKREFRSIARLVHPNLIRLFELGMDPEGLYFTMEVVHGEPFPGPPIDEPRTRVARLVALLPRLLETLGFLHAHGIIHRDIKPSNVLVRDDRSLVLLDFGILADASFGSGSPFDERPIGTIGYVAPEQIRGETQGAATDLYALGALLFGAASGSPVFRGSSAEVLHRHLTERPPLLSSVCPEVPEALSRACADLLEKDPSRRPTLEALTARLALFFGEAPRDPVASLARPPSRLVGRERLEREILTPIWRCQDGAFSCTALVGPTGVGKTALLQQTAATAEGQGYVILAGSGRPDEHVPFNAVDGAMDALAAALSDWPADGELADALGRASQAFPVLAPPETAPEPEPDRTGARTDAFDGVIRAMAALAELNGVLLVIDDLHWADEDALALLSRIVQQAPRGVAVLVTCQDDVGPNLGKRWIEDHDLALSLKAVDPLPETAVRALIEAAIVGRKAGPAPGAVDRAVAQCEGRPFLAELAGRALARDGEEQPSLESFVSVAIRRIDDRPRNLLALLLANGWTELGSLPLLLGCRRGQIDDALTELESVGLVRRARTFDPRAAVDLSHDTVRVGVAGAIGPLAVRQAHEVFVQHLSRDEDANLYRLVHHILGAGRLTDAAERAIPAARRAEATLAFSLAADMYDIAARHLGRDRLELLRGRARNLDRAGRYAECASCWEEIGRAEAADEANHTDALLREVSARYAANQQLEAHAKLPAALRAGGFAPLIGGPSKIIDLVRFALGPRKPPGRGKPAAGGHNGTSPRAERDLSLAFLVFMADRPSGVRLMVRVRDELARRGDYVAATICDYGLAGCALNLEVRGGPAPLAEKYRIAAEGRGVDQDSSRLVTAARLAFEMTRLVRFGEWDDASSLSHRLVDLLESNGMQGTMFHRLGLVANLAAATFSQDLQVAVREERRLEIDLRETRNNWLAATAPRMTLKLYRSDASTEDIDRWLRPDGGRFAPHQQTEHDLATAVAEWLGGDTVGAARKMRRAFRRHLRGRPHMFTGVFASIAAMTEVSALGAGDSEASPRFVERCVRLAERGPPFAVTRARRALAYLADARGRTDLAIAELTRAETEAARRSQTLDVAIARYQRGARLLGDEGAALKTEAHATVERLGLSTRCLEEPRLPARG